MYLSNNNFNQSLEVFKDYIYKDINVCIPAIVQEYNSDTDIVKLNTVIKEDKKIYSGIPVLRIKLGGFTISSKVKAGDYGLLIACDRDISGFLETRNVSEVKDNRMHSFSFGFFLPFDFEKQQSNEGISIKSDKTELNLTDNSCSLKVNNVDIFTATNNNITFNVPIIDSDGINLNNHKHSQANDSAGNTEQDTGIPK